MSIQDTKGKNKKAQRAIDNRAPKTVENPKVAMFIKGHKTSEIINSCFNDLMSLKKPDVLRYFKKKSNGEHGPFESPNSVEFFSQKSDASLFCYGSHSKKRPHNLTFGRLFDYHMLDMLEVGLTNYHPINLAAQKLPMLGSKACFTVIGAEFNTNPVYEMAANLMVDFFRGHVVDNINLAGLDHVISLSVGASGAIQFRHYSVHLKRSGGKVPRVELEDIGPSFDLVIRRHQYGDEALRKQALRKPKELNPKKTKNVTTNPFHDKVANIHIPKQNIGQIEKNAVKPKALKRPTAMKRKRSAEDAGENAQKKLKSE